MLSRATAILIPVYNEDPAEVSGRVAAMYRSLAATGQLEAFDFFVLSDTMNAEIGAARRSGHTRPCASGWAPALACSTAAARSNTGKKAGNVAEWVETRGRGL